MPYIKPKDPPFIKMQRLLKGYGLSGRKLAAILEVSPPTGAARLAEPEMLTLRDLDRINRFAHIPMEEIREAITK